jgi:2-polyprenyl-3-methyl-5-hydroxy-6-metoxy-1,4-benzoquinol methylase
MPICPVCQSRNPSELFKKRGVDYWRCDACGFRFSTPAANANLANELSDFESAYLSYLGPDPADDRNFANLVRWMSRFSPLESRSVLDVGCGGGKLVRYLRARGIDAQGIEPSDALYQRFLASETVFFHGTTDDFAQQNPGGTFDLVTAFDVIEHTPDPASFVRSLAALLKPGGTMFLSAPDAGSLTATLLGKYWHHYNRYHLSYLSAPIVRRIARDRGLEMLHVSRRGRSRSLGQVVRYLFDFGFGVAPPKIARVADSIFFPLNVFDTMYVALRKPT